ncbi:MAG: UDP-N-acetylmuramoyl-L-alanine--D-glutamate ligase [Bacillota bacterium]
MIKGKQILVIGMARSGLAAVKLLAEMNAAKITIADKKEASALEKELAGLEHYTNVEAVTGGTPPELVNADFSMVVKSPGVPPDLDIFKRARSLGLPVISEIELAYAFTKAPIVGVTGTNGKTTTTALIAAMLKEAHFDPVVTAGNIGNPLVGVVDSIGAQGFIVAELSSFQLEDIKNFRSVVAVFLNFSEDHLDYHGTIERYYLAKARIFENQTRSDFAVLNASDSKVSSLEGAGRSRTLWFARGKVPLGAGLEDDWVVLYTGKTEPVRLCQKDAVALPGGHNLENALAAAAASWAAGADPESIGAVLRSFRAIEHRLEPVATLQGVHYINDSKGTNPGASIKALQSFPGQGIILLAGGKDKGADFSGLAEVIADKAQLVLLYGETREQLARALDRAGFKSYKFVKNLDEAVEQASSEAIAGEIVLLSPACASWDMFPDYEARGRRFKDLIGTLKNRETGKGGRENGLA